jgi:hypothetical protein
MSVTVFKLANQRGVRLQLLSQPSDGGEFIVDGNFSPDQLPYITVATRRLAA